MADRILYDPSRKVFKVALEAVSTLIAILHRNSRHRMNDASIPTLSRSAASSAASINATLTDLGSSFAEPFELFAKANVWQSNDPELAPLTPSTTTATYATMGSFASNSGQVKTSQSSLEKIGHIVFVKLMPHIYTFVNRCRWLDPSDLPPALVVLSTLLQRLEDLAGDSNIQVHFMTSPKHLISEVVETFLFPLLYSKDEALVFEAASNLIVITQTNNSFNPGWVLAACRALIGLLSRDSVRSVIKRVMPVLFASLRLLSPGVLLPVIILALQHVHKLQLPSSQRLTVFYRLIQIPIQLCEQGSLDSVVFFSSFLKHPWIAALISNTTEENQFREDLFGTVMKSLYEHWNDVRDQAQTTDPLGSRLMTGLRRNHSDSESLSSSNAAASRKSKRLSSSLAISSSGGGGGSGSLTSLGGTNGLGGAGGGDGSTSPRSPAQKLRKLKAWREVLYLTVVGLVKAVQWKTHVRTYCYLIYLNLVDGVGQALAFSKSARPQLRDLLTRVLESSVHLKSDAVCLRFFYVILKHALDSGMAKLVEALYKATQLRFLGFLEPTTAVSSARTLGYSVDKLCKTSLSPADLEVLVLLLHMFSKHPAICDPIADDEGGGAPRPNPKLAATLHYIESIKKYKGDDPVSVHRYERLPQVATSHNIQNLALASSKTSSSGGSGQHTPNLGGPLSPMSSATSSGRSRKGSKSSAPPYSPGGANSPATSIVPSGLEGAKTFVPPIEYTAKEVAEKHPDDEFLITYSKGRLPNYEAIDAQRQLEHPTTLTSPSDPFIVEAYHVLSTECARVTFFLRMTNLTNFTVPKVLLFVDTKGRLEPFNRSIETHTEFQKVEPGETMVWHTAFKLNYMHVNELLVRLILVPAADKISQTLDMQCIPYRINMHVMVLPWIIGYSDFIREWGRYTNTASFQLYLDRSVQLTQLDEAISKCYQPQVCWNYNDTFQLSYSGITWWDERLLFSIFGARDDEDSPYQLRFELRTSTPNLCVIIDTNKDYWLRDLLPFTPHWFTLSTDVTMATDSLWGRDFEAVELATRIVMNTDSNQSALDEKLLLEQWSKAKAF
jgi:hypothetical protein